MLSGFTLQPYSRFCQDGCVDLASVGAFALPEQILPRNAGIRVARSSGVESHLS